MKNSDVSKEKYDSLSHFFCLPAAAVASCDDIIPLTPSRMSQRQVKERDKEREKEAGLQTPNREHVTSPATLSPGVSYSHGEKHFILTRLTRLFFKLVLKILANLNEATLTGHKAHHSNLLTNVYTNSKTINTLVRGFRSLASIHITILYK